MPIPITAALLWLLAGFVSPAVAEERIPAYPGGTLVFEEERENVEHQLALGSITRTGGRWQPAVVDRMRGDLQRRTYLVPDAYSAEEAHRYYLQKWRPQTRRVLFECSGRGCGSSNFWANNVFGLKELYGPDDNQRYSVVELDADGSTVVAAIYSIKRANRREYIHLEWLQRDEAVGGSGIDVAELMRVKQPVVVLPTAEGWNKDVITAVAKVMAVDGDIALYVVGHSYDGPTLEAMQEVSLANARAVADALIAAGVDSERLSVHGVGPLAPMVTSMKRVELIRR